MPNASSKPPNEGRATPRRGANGLRAARPSRRGPARLAPLSVLPLFADLRGRPVLVVGGGEGAAWKAELLAAAGAHVRLVLGGGEEGFCEAARELASRARNVRVTDRAWTAHDLAGLGPPDATGIAPDRPVLALIDTPCHGEAGAFAALARAMGVTVNAIDKPVHGDVTFGSIVNRSPIVVGISTDGAAPILGQAIRQRIETLLPPGLADWAGAMRRSRSRVMAMLPDRSRRRAFFERFADRAFRQAFPEGADDPILDLAVAASDAPDEPVGHVTLVGAGPGGAGLLTLDAVRALQSADIVLFDALVGEDVLELARREARRMLVGKRAGRESCRQEDINALMLKLARQGRRVVRLKSGDPMVFGRAGEEIEALEREGVTHAIVPGVTAAQALAASLGMSLTHRAHARSLRLVTGHGAKGGLPDDLDWPGLADPATTLVVYMGARTARSLAERLVASGLPPDTPAAAVSALTRPEERRWIGRIDALADGVATLDADQPIAIAIGDALRFARTAEAEDKTPRAA